MNPGFTTYHRPRYTPDDFTREAKYGSARLPVNLASTLLAAAMSAGQ